MLNRQDGREALQMRPVTIIPDYLMHAEGSVLINCGQTKVICTASVEERVPPFLKGSGKGWVTSEYGMLPRSTSTRMIRESSKGKPSGRTQEIQRIIGRALRSVVNLDQLGERTIWIDCDVIQADGGTRTASITGAFVAMGLAMQKLVSGGNLPRIPIIDYLAAVSVGIVGGAVCLDLAYSEDSGAEVDMNVVMTGSGQFVEVQGTAEGKPFSRQQLDGLLDVAAAGIRELLQIQREVFAARLGDADALIQGAPSAGSTGDRE